MGRGRARLDNLQQVELVLQGTASFFAVNLKAMLSKPFAPQKSSSRPSSRKSPDPLAPAGARCSANTPLSARNSLIINQRDFETVEDGLRNTNGNSRRNPKIAEKL
jgi:hypothetical protein